MLENAFGILTSRWQIFKRSISLHPNKVDAIVLATCILHNFLLQPADNQRWLDEQEGNNLEDMERMRLGNRWAGSTCCQRQAVPIFKFATRKCAMAEPYGVV